MGDVEPWQRYALYLVQFFVMEWVVVLLCCLFFFFFSQQSRMVVRALVCPPHWGHLTPHL